jgi:hypothetical protein
VVGPAFLLHEPFYTTERPGAVIVGFALLAIAAWSGACVRLIRALCASWRFERAWLRPAAVHSAAGAPLPFHVIDTSSPLVGLVGVLRPRLVISSDIVSLCSEPELAAISAHEAAHLTARDNLKRLCLDACPDGLRWTPMHDWLVKPWAAAAEDEADDCATGSKPRGRLLLAGLLVRLARLAPDRALAPQTTSPFVADDVERRVRRLVDEPGRFTSSPFPWPAITAVTLLVPIATAAATPAVTITVHGAVEFLVSLWR